ncbi:MAG: mechanosensitive ion channel family protein [Gemmatimonadota bacterium]
MSPLLLVVQEAAETGARGVLSGIRFDLGAWIRAGVLLFVGIPVLYGLSKWVRGWVGGAASAQRGLIVGKLLWYAGLATLVVTALMELGFDLAPLLGAAGILGIALGFASQTSVSNVISGFFLMAEQPFVVGDVIQVGTTVGTVLSIDMMSVKLRTFDNKFIRIPNESLVKSEVTTITRFPIRRIDVMVGVAYKEDIGRVRDVLMDVADTNTTCLMEPRPMVIFEGYGDSSLNFRFTVWAARENWLKLKNEIHEQIKARFDREGIEIPFPHRTLYAGSVTDPFPVRVVEEGEGRRPGGEARGAGEA